MMINEQNKKSIKEMMKGRAVYIALSVCVLAAGVISYASIRAPKPVTNAPGTTARPETSTYTHINERVLPDEPSFSLPAQVSDPVPSETQPAPETQAVFDNAAEPLESTTAAAKQIVYSLPCGAKLGADFSMGVPVFSETMGDYRTHNGVDFMAEPGTPVCAVAEGKVIKVENDPLFGNTVTVDHGSGVVSRISGLANEGLIHEGADVYTETALGVVGALPVEQADGSHIHLEIRVNGALQDPLEIMGYAADGE